MNEQFVKQAEKFMRDAADPQGLQMMAQEGVAKTREAYSKMTAVTADGAKAFEAIAAETQQGAKALFDKVAQDFAVNTEAALDAAEAMAKAKSFPEAAKVQADFFQSQLAKVGAQTKEFFELSSKVATQTFAAFNGAAVKTAETAKKAKK
jgi:hypothetical protein